MNLLLAFVAFNVIVIVHELGHFLAAKKFGIKVLEFSLFIGPKLYSFTHGETQYSLRLFPIMAFVKMEGEEEASTSERAFNNKPKYARALTAFGGPLANILLAMVLVVAVFSINGYETLTVKTVQAGSSADLIGIKAGDTIVGYDHNRTYLPLDVSQFLYVSKGVPSSIEFERNGERITRTITPEIVKASANYYIGVSTDDKNVIKSLNTGFPAEQAGLKPGDRIIRMDDTELGNQSEMKSYIQKKGAQEIKVTVLRNAKEVGFKLIPQIQKIPEQYFLGVDFVVKKGGILTYVRQSAVFAWAIVRSVGYSIVWLVQHKVEFNQLMGPIGMVSTIGEVVKQSPDVVSMLVNLFQMTAFMSIAVGATNLIPFPMLDGNRILLIGLEAVRRKPIKPEIEAYISMVGFVLIILLAIYAAFNDIMRIVKG